jgi:hypothetical protein
MVSINPWTGIWIIRAADEQISVFCIYLYLLFHGIDTGSDYLLAQNSTHHFISRPGLLVIFFAVVKYFPEVEICKLNIDFFTSSDIASEIDFLNLSV